MVFCLDTFSLILTCVTVISLRFTWHSNDLQTSRQLIKSREFIKQSTWSNVLDKRASIFGEKVSTKLFVARETCDSKRCGETIDAIESVDSSTLTLSDQ